MPVSQLNAAPEREVEIQASIGRTLWQLQAFEETLARFIALGLNLPEKASLSEARSILEGRRKKVLGKLIEEAKKIVAFDPSFDLFMARFLNARNWLVHRSWRTHRDYGKNDEDFIDLRYRISRLSSDATEFDGFFTEITCSLLRARGITGQEIELSLADFDKASSEA